MVIDCFQFKCNAENGRYGQTLNSVHLRQIQKLWLSNAVS